MRMVLVTGDGLQHIYVANALASAFPLDAIVLDHGIRRGPAVAARRLFRKYTLTQLASRAHVALMRRVWRDEVVARRSMIATYGSGGCLEFRRADLLRPVHGINTAEGLRVVSSLKPDVMLIYGTVVVGSKVLSMARTIALNLHTGVSPYYRGADCPFWALYNEELNMIGATVHECTMDIDGGRVFGTARARLDPADDVFSVFARSVMAGADLYVEMLQNLIAGQAEGALQDLSLGREYRGYMRNVSAERKVRRSVREGLIRRYVQSGDAIGGRRATRGEEGSP